MNDILLILILLVVVSSQCDCGRYSSDCTRFGNFGQRVYYKVGVENDEVASIKQTTRYYSTSDCSNSPLVVLTTVYDVTKNTTRTDYTNEYLLHVATVNDYLILSSNVNYLSLLGVTCSPSLQNDVEVSLKVTTCNSTTGIIEGNEYIGSRTPLYIRFSSISSLRISVTYPLIDIISYDRVDNEGCMGCKANGVWGDSDVGVTRKAFCPSPQSGYISQACVIGSTGNGMWSGNRLSECSEIVTDPKLDNGEGYFRGMIQMDIQPDLFTAEEHEYMMDLLRDQVTGNDLPSKAFVPEAVRNVNTLDKRSDSSKPVEIDFRVIGETSKVKKALKSISSVMNKGSLHKKMIIRNQMYFDVTMSFDDEIEIISNNTATIVTTVGVFIGIILITIIVVLIVLLVRKSPKRKIQKADVESGSEYDSYSDSYSEYSDYSEESIV